MVSSIAASGLASKLNPVLFSAIADACVNGLCGRREAAPKCDLTEDEIKIVVNSIKSAIDTILKLNLGPQQIISDEWAKLDSKYTELLHQCLEKRPQDVKIIRKNIILNRVNPNLKDYNWDVKWVLGSSNLASLEEPLACFNFILPGGISHMVEMNKSEIDRLIQSLESK